MLRDCVYFAVVALNVGMSIYYVVFDVVILLWVVDYMNVLCWIVVVLLIINIVVVLLF